MAMNDHIMPPPDDYDDTTSDDSDTCDFTAQCMPTPDDYDHETTRCKTEESTKKGIPKNSTLTARYISWKGNHYQGQGDAYQKNVQVNEHSIREKLANVLDKLLSNRLLEPLSTYLLSLPIKALTFFFLKWIKWDNFNFDTSINEDDKGEEGQDFHLLEETKCTKFIARCMSSLFLGLKNNIAIFVCLFFTLFNLTSGNNLSVEWKIYSPIILGNFTTLEIFIPTKLVESESGTNTWRGGKDYKLISFDNVSSNRSKYEVKKILSGNGSVHTLVIKDVSETDLNVNYTRQIGFAQFNTTLNLKDNVCVRLPNNNTIDKYLYVKGNKLNGHIVLDAVYPPPKCQFVQGTRVIDNTEILRSETKTSIASTQVTFKFNASVGTNCGNITMICSVATITIREVFVVENCTVNKQEYKERSDIPVIVGCGIVVPASIILGILLFICRIRKKRGRYNIIFKCCIQPQDARHLSDIEKNQENGESSLRVLNTIEGNGKEKQQPENQSGLISL